MRKYLPLFAAALTLASPCLAQTDNDDDQITVSGSVQSDILFPQSDSKIHTEETSDDVLTNTYVDVNVTSKHADAGARFEYLDHPLPGFEKPDFAGYGLPYYYVKGHWDKLEVTLGGFYEQFGSGFILRSYEERSLGIDNHLRGARVMAKPFKGVTVKALAGQQRRYWEYNHAWIYGGDLEIAFEQWFKGLRTSGTYLTFGASWVTRHQGQTQQIVNGYQLNEPENVGAYDLRLRLQKGGLNILAEYAQKGQDPNKNNGYIYRKGHVAMLSASYSKRGMSLLLQAKRSDNMVFRSDRDAEPRSTAGYINHLPAFTMDHTYALAALYPYATQPDGEWAYQAELGYNFKKHSFLGGKYGTKVKVNFSYIRAIDKQTVDNGGMGTDGYTSKFFKWGDDRYYQDLNIQLEKKVSRDFKLNLMYMNQFYNNNVLKAVEREDGGYVGMIHSNIFVAEGKYRFNNTLTLRAEAQYLTTGEAQGDWVYGLLELSVLPHWMITASDMYNAGETGLHYYQGLVTYTAGSHRLQLGYGRTRAGYNCSGGVCRYVPATKGFTVSYNYNF